MSRKRHVRYVAARAHSEFSAAEYLRARLEDGVQTAVTPAPNRETRRKQRKAKR